MNTQGKSAILLATYNGEAYLRPQLDSLLEQSYENFVICVHDDGSRDGTKAILEEYAEKYPGKLLLLPGAATGSSRDNFFYLMGQVEAPYYFFCDQDDIWLPRKLSLCHEKMAKLETDGLPALVFTDLSVADESGNILHRRMSEFQSLPPEAATFSRLLMQNVVTGCTVMINRTLRDMALLPIPAEGVIMHDWFLALVAARFGSIGFVDVPTLLYRQHGGNAVGAKNIRSADYILSRLTSGKLRTSLADTRTQAAFFAEYFGEAEDSLAARYGKLEKESKLRRLRFYEKEGVKKSGLLRNLGLIIFG